MWFIAGPVAVFAVVLFTRLRWTAIAAAGAGVAAAIAVGSSLGLFMAGPGGDLLLFIYFVIVSVAMAFAEGLVAWILSGQGLLGALGAFGLAYGAHTVLIYMAWRELAAAPVGPFFVFPALLGGAAAAIGSQLGHRPPR